MPDIKIFSPDTMGKPLGPYSQITRVKASEFVFIAARSVPIATARSVRISMRSARSPMPMSRRR